jgi:hypothetical protein
MGKNNSLRTSRGRGALMDEGKMKEEDKSEASVITGGAT